MRFLVFAPDAGLFLEVIKVTRDGRNRYKVFYLTAKGKEMAQQIKGLQWTDASKHAN